VAATTTACVGEDTGEPEKEEDDDEDDEEEVEVEEKGVRAYWEDFLNLSPTPT